MAQKKAHESDSWLTRPDDKFRVVLIYGPDHGLVSERSKVFAGSTGLQLDDPFAVLKLDASDLTGDTSRLVDEARTISMFGGKRLIWLRGATSDKALADAIKVLCEEPPVDAFVLIEAGDLKKGATLRRVVEQAPQAMALPCYPDNTRTIDELIDEELSKADLAISLEARQMLKASLGGDRIASRNEIEKLALYCRGKLQIEPDDVSLSVGDVAAQSQDAITDAVLTGNTRNYETAFSRFIASGSNPQLVFFAMVRQLQLLQQMRHRLDHSGSNAASIVASAKPPVFFARRKTVEGALVRWRSELIARALARLQEATFKSRANADLASSICRQTLLALCLEAARARR